VRAAETATPASAARDPKLFPDLAAISFDFGNTLVPFPGGPMADVLAITATACARLAGSTVDEFVRVWGVERLRQFAEDVPEGREADMDVRARRVLAALKGAPLPKDGSRWDDAALTQVVGEADVNAVLEAYAGAFVKVTPVPPLVGPMLERLARQYRLAVVSNWPLALSIERFLENAGWLAHLSAVVVSHRVGSIKPRPEIFEVAASELGVPSGPRIIHVGDDVGADVAGARAAGWRTAWVKVKPEDSPLPVAPPAPGEIPDITIDTVLDLEAALGLVGRA
jgi:FMN phosphatase YigB (HAD superfamily)